VESRVKDYPSSREKNQPSQFKEQKKKGRNRERMRDESQGRKNQNVLNFLWFVTQSRNVRSKMLKNFTRKIHNQKASKTQKPKYPKIL